jgi:hypothetical protein
MHDDVKQGVSNRGKDAAVDIRTTAAAFKEN